MSVHAAPLAPAAGTHGRHRRRRQRRRVVGPMPKKFTRGADRHRRYTALEILSIPTQEQVDPIIPMHDLAGREQVPYANICRWVRDTGKYDAAVQQSRVWRPKRDPNRLPSCSPLATARRFSVPRGSPVPSDTL